ncbi:Gfo/Idh/MocA family protein [Streptomyces sp. NPDC000880]
MRIGIAGCGIRGQLFARALAHEPGVEVVGMCDPSPTARIRASEMFTGAIHDDHLALIAERLDALIVATPDFAHRTVAVDAANAGLQLMVEKPIATSSDDAHAIEEAVASAGVSCFVAFENRWNPYFRKVRRMVADGELGDIVSITAVLSNSYYVPTTMLSWSRLSSPAWFLMPHILDLSMWISDSQPRSVVARGRRGELDSRGIDTWDSVHALIDLGGSAVANLRTEWVLPDGRPSIVDFRVDVVGTRGTVTVDHGDQGLHLATEGAYRSLGSLPEDIDGEEQSMAAWMVRSWARGLRTGAPVGPDASHGALITRVVEAAHQSLTSGDAYTLD